MPVLSRLDTGRSEWQFCRRHLLRLLGVGFAYYLRAVLCTARIRIMQEPQAHEYLGGRYGILILTWHGYLPLCLLIGRIIVSNRFKATWPYDIGLTSLVSPRAEGVLFKEAMRRFDIPTIDSGVQGVKNVRRSIADRRAIATAADGPRGPSGLVNPSVLRLAVHSGATMVPLACAASRALRFPTWDRFILPLPFTKLVFVWGDPMPVPEPALGIDGVDLGCERVRQRLAALTETAEKLAVDRRSACRLA